MKKLRDQPAARADHDPLAVPARARALWLLVDLRRPATTREIAAHLGLHPNGVRIHLERLEAAGLVERRVVRAGRGRPHHEWAVSAHALPVAPDVQPQLAGWLAGALAAGASSPDELEGFGVGIGEQLAPDSPGPAAEALAHTLAAMGFQPEQRGRGRLTVYKLRNCPYRVAVRSGGRHVCALHAGITRGLLARMAPDAELVGFVAKDPERGGCVLEVEGLAAQPPPSQ